MIIDPLSKHNFISVLQHTISYLKKRGAEYADIRFEETVSEGVMARDGEVDRLWDNLDTGFGIRVLYRGAWGFAASSLLTETEARKAACEAISQAKAIAKISHKPPSLHFNSPLPALRSKKIHTIEGFLDFQKTHKTFLNTEGSFIEQEIFTSGAGIKVIVIDGNDVQMRSFPDSHHGLFRQGG